MREGWLATVNLYPLTTYDIGRAPLSSRSSYGSAIASNLAVVFHAASARRFGPGRADVVHYFPLRTTMSPRPTRQPKIDGRPVCAEVSPSPPPHTLRPTP